MGFRWDSVHGGYRRFVNVNYSPLLKQERLDELVILVNPSLVIIFRVRSPEA
jgi:hypothetical protein